ncbi:hypothetical protein HPB47_025258 [Ixodes persulcatus]|uniref:Uncharacterized protein n=1 Tax=Ixodes persulcatus TaxID=34615 RepID=A0AC60Q203_IXOPE|nr:hypothetical protein HPB47_025258 [Ixodes persulcatus]
MTDPLSHKNSSTPPPPLTVWQWNCRSFRNKKPSLTLLALQHSPDLIALQETNTDNVSLRGYTTYATDPTSRTAVLVQATQTARTHTLPTTIDYTFVELLPRKKTEASLYVLNIYSPPTQPLPAIDRLLRIVRQRTRGHKLVVLGDFNTQHTAWGYDPRHDVYVQRQTGYMVAAGRNSGHLEDWTTQLLENARENTKELSHTQDNPAIDAHLLHLWDARNGLLRRATLSRLGYTPPADCEQKKRIPLAIRHSIKHSPDSSFTRYTDASPYPQQPAHAVSVTDAHCKELTTATILTTSIETAEELAIALAATTAAHAAARAHTHRAVSQEGKDTQTPYTFKPTRLQKYADILAHYRHERRQFPPPHPYLSRAEATAFRRLRTNSYSHGTLLHAMYPTLYPATCNLCSQPGTLYHMVWECQQTPSLAPNPHATYEQWVGQLTSSDLSAQRSLVERARAASADQGFPD